jgi:hypothetical protein
MTALEKRATDAENALSIAVGSSRSDVQNAYRVLEVEAKLATATAERDKLAEERRELDEQVSLLRRRNELLLNEMSDHWDQANEDQREKDAGITPDESMKMELDNTIAALHSRDVRCEELAFEVTCVSINSVCDLNENQDDIQVKELLGTNILNNRCI